MKNGEYISYYENGFIQEKCTFLNSKKVGAHYFYTDDGLISSKWNWKDGKVHGLCVNYKINIDDGRLSSVNNYKDGLEHGKQQEYFDDKYANIQVEYNCDEEIFVGLFKLYYANGDIYIKGKFGDDGTISADWEIFGFENNEAKTISSSEVDDQIIEGYLVDFFEITEIGKTNAGKIIYGLDRRY